MLTFVVLFLLSQGTCDNYTKNDCRLPTGKIHPSCSRMAYDWRVEDKSKPYCENLPSPPTPTPTAKPPPPGPCNPDICEILNST